MISECISMGYQYDFWVHQYAREIEFLAMGVQNDTVWFLT